MRASLLQCADYPYLCDTYIKCTACNCFIITLLIRVEGASLCLFASLVQCLFQDMKISCPRILDVEDSAIGFLETGCEAECGVSYPMVLPWIEPELLFCHCNFGHVLTCDICGEQL